jgi:hypothetical protein
MNLEQRTQALLALIDAHRTRRCAEILEPARAQAQAAVRAALAEARRRVQASLAEARALAAAEVGAAQARLATGQRLAAQRHASLLLAQAWQALRNELQARWQDEAARSRWCADALRRAPAELPREPRWRIDCAPDWPAAERTRAVTVLAGQGIDAEVVADTAIAAGLRLRAGSNVLDATADGLLADRAGLQGRLLQALGEDAG